MGEQVCCFDQAESGPNLCILSEKILYSYMQYYSFNQQLLGSSAEMAACALLLFDLYRFWPIGGIMTHTYSVKNGQDTT